MPILSRASVEPWRITCEVETVGRDYVCRIQGGDGHIGSVALSYPQAGRIVTDSLTVARHREREIAIQAARSLCEATHRSVCCIAGIHFDGVTRSEIEQIVRTARTLIEEVAAELER